MDCKQLLVTDSVSVILKLDHYKWSDFSEIQSFSADLRKDCSHQQDFTVGLSAAAEKSAGIR